MSRLRCGRLLLALLLTAPLAAEPPATRYGPRATLTGEFTLTQAADRLGRQLNRRLAVPYKLGQQRCVWSVQNATVAETLRAVEETAGVRVRRQSRMTYSVDAGQPLGQIGQRLGDYRVWLPSVQYTFVSYLMPGDPARNQRRSMVAPQFVVEAPSDPEALRIASLGGLAGAQPDEDLAAMNPQAATRQPAPGDPRTWSLAVNLGAPRPPADELARVWFDITWVQSLTELRFDYPLKVNVPQLQTDGDYDARLEPRRAQEPWSRGVVVAIGGLEPPGPTWVEGRFYDDQDQPLYTDARAEAATLPERPWSTGWRFVPLEPDALKVPARLELRLYLPGPAGDSDRVTFEHVPLPPRAR